MKRNSLSEAGWWGGVVSFLLLRASEDPVSARAAGASALMLVILDQLCWGGYEGFPVEVPSCLSQRLTVYMVGSRTLFLSMGSTIPSKN